MNVRRTLTAVLTATAVLAGSAAATLTTAPTAQAATGIPTPGPGLDLKPGKNHKGTLHAGAWKYQGRNLWCVSYGLQGPDGAVRTVSSAIGLAKVDVAWVNTVVNKYGATTDNATAAALWAALAQRIADHATAQPTADMRARAAKLKADIGGYRTQLGTTDALVKRILATPAGPYTVRVVLTGAVPGQAGKAVATVTTTTGQPVPDVPVTFALNGGTPASAKRTTDTAGRATLAFTATGLGQTVTATATTPRADAVIANTPSAGHQITFGRLGDTPVKASDAAELCPLTLKVTKGCDCTKTGVRPVTLTFTAEDFPGRYVAIVRVNGTPTKSQALDAGETVTLTVPVRNGDTVEASYSITDATGHALWTEVLDTFTQGAGR